jgi:tetratricopeptide (TPR) repeat protein
MASFDPALIHRAKQSVARILGTRGEERVSIGTGFLIAPRLILTCHHVGFEAFSEDNGFELVEAVFEGKLGLSIPVEIFEPGSASIDLTILRLKEDVDLMPIRAAKGERRGTAFFTYGYPEDQDGMGVESFGILGGQTSTKDLSRRIALAVDGNYMISVGNSGGPVIITDDDGQLSFLGCVSETGSAVRPDLASYAPLEDLLVEQPSLLRHFASTPTQAEAPFAVYDLLPAMAFFVDRDEPRERLRAFLNDPRKVLAVIGGLPGIGKTSLAAQITQALPPEFSGIFWCDCRTGEATLDLVLSKLHSFFEALGVQDLASVWNATAQHQMTATVSVVIRILHAQKYLLVFDGFESWLNEEGLISNEQVRALFFGMLNFAHVSKLILVTSHRPLFHPTRPLPLGISFSETLEGLDHEHALALLREAGFTSADHLLAERIIEACGGNPYRLILYASEWALNGGESDELNLEPVDSLIKAKISRLSEQSRNALEIFSVFRLPVQISMAKIMGFDYQKDVRPLIQNYLVAEDTSKQNLNVPGLVRRVTMASLNPERLQTVHLKAAAEYAEKRGIAAPVKYEDVLRDLEGSYHLREAGNLDGSARKILWACSFLIDWGYTDVAASYLDRLLQSNLPPNLFGQSRLLKARILDVRGEYRECLAMLGEALAQFETLDDWLGQAKALLAIGSNYNVLGQYDSAELRLRRGLEICSEHGLKELRPKLLLPLSWNQLQTKSAGDDALVLYGECLTAAEEVQDFESLSSAHRQIGFFLGTRKNDKLGALNHLDAAAEIAKNHDYAKELAAILSEKGFLYSKWGDPIEAKHFSEKAIDLFRVIGDISGLASATCNLGFAYSKDQDHPSAIQKFRESSSLFESISNHGGQADAERLLGISLVATSALEEGRVHLIKAVNISQQYGLQETLKSASEQLNKLE